MYYHNISKDDQLNGDGLRVVLWVSGCKHHCPECQNKQTWEVDSGIPFDYSAFSEIFEELKKDYISGITFSGGDPLHSSNLYDILNLCISIKSHYKNKSIWLYTGYTFEELIDHSYLGHKRRSILEYCDVLVDGRYEKDLRNANLKWRGSSNQRVIDVQRSLKEHKIVLWCD